MEGNYYRNGFLHSRVKEYMKINANIQYEVFNIDSSKPLHEYTFENVRVIIGSEEELLDIYSKENYKKILIHFLDTKIMNFIYKVGFDIPIIIWIHGVEALSWKRRLFNIRQAKFIKQVMANTRQIYNLKRFLKYTKNKNIEYVFVSKWMKHVMEEDTGVKVEKHHIIPNVVRTELFEFNQKGIESRKNILLIRPFSTYKYANDIAVKAILELEKWEHFKELNFTIVGEGRLYNKLTAPLQNIKNVRLVNNFLSQKEIVNYHKGHGIFLCPTRQDAQGVSMCEAMSSGLVPISSNNTAIPEYLHDNIGFLTTSPKSIADAIKYLYFNPQKFVEMSYETSQFINQKCGIQNTILEEYKLIIDDTI
jgi:glycosyltransferase involved in cell wall biosynthesis